LNIKAVLEKANEVASVDPEHAGALAKEYRKAKTLPLLPPASMADNYTQFDQSLTKLFGYLIVDEAHGVADNHSAGHIALLWLLAALRLLITATPYLTDPKDLCGLMDLFCDRRSLEGRHFQSCMGAGFL